MQSMRFIQKVFAAKNLLSGKFSIFSDSASHLLMPKIILIFSLVNFSDASFQKQKSEGLKPTHLVMPGGPGSPNGSITNSDSSSLISQPISNQSASSSSTLEASHLSHLGFPAPWHPTPPPADLRAPSRNFVHGSQLVHGSPSWTSTVPSPCSPGLSPTGETKNHAQQDGLGLVPWDTTR